MGRFNFHICGNFKTSYEEDLTLFQTDASRLWLIMGLIVVFILVPIAGNPHVMKILNMIGIYSIAAIGLNILTGYTGMISLGHSAIFGVGAYTSVILASGMNAPFWLAVPAGGVMSAIIGIGFGLPSLRLKGLYLCFATIACQKIMEFIFIHWEGITGGTEGITLSKTASWGLDLKNDMILYYIVFLLLALTAWTSVNLVRSKFGRAFCAIRDNQKVAGALGIPVIKYRLLSFAVSSFYAGIAGALFAYYNLNISPVDFSLAFSVILIAMIIIGGMGSVQGSIYGAVVIVLTKEASIYGERLLAEMFDMHFTDSFLYEFVAGLLIVLFIIFRPKGLAGIWRDISSVFRAWPLTQGVNHGSKR